MHGLDVVAVGVEQERRVVAAAFVGAVLLANARSAVVAVPRFDPGAMEGVDLEVRPAALQAIARKALKRKTGARGLRSILEQTLLDIMFDLPSLQNVQKVVVDENSIDGDGKPLVIYADKPRVSGSN